MTTATLTPIGYKQPTVPWNGLTAVGGSRENKNGSESATNTQRSLTLNRIGLDRRAAMQSTHSCTVANCDRTGKSLVEGQRVCLMHYKRWKRHSDVNVTKRAYSPPNPIKSLCGVDGCETPEDGACGYCKLHMTRMRRHGDPLTFIASEDRQLPSGARSYQWTGDYATYRAMHQRVRAQRGSASTHKCTDCGGRAQHWPYDRNDTDERSSGAGPYSVDIAHYEPRCVRCHKVFDLAAIRTRSA